MAHAVMEGAKEAGAECTLFTAAEFDASLLASLDGVAFGCPAMGAEVLETLEFEPMFDKCKGKLSGKRVALFGSYGWGDGEWMRNWEEACLSDGVKLACDSVICNDAPDDDGIDSCKSMGAALVK